MKIQRSIVSVILLLLMLSLGACHHQPLQIELTGTVALHGSVPAQR